MTKQALLASSQLGADMRAPEAPLVERTHEPPPAIARRISQRRRARYGVTQHFQIDAYYHYRQPKRRICQCRLTRRSSHDSIEIRSGMDLVVMGLTLYSAFVALPTGKSMRIPRPWGEEFACEMAKKPSWPFAYSKYREQKVETKGRTNTNLQDDRHRCDRRGVRSKCHLCEDIACGTDLDNTCGYQLQGVNASLLSTNVPTVSDTPWAVGGRHRNDFGNASVSRVCIMLSGDTCLRPFGGDYSNCTTRCWGHGFTGSDSAVITHDEPQGPMVDDSARHRTTAAWEYPKALASSYGPLEPYPGFNPQGYVFTLAGGSGLAGYSDGNGISALFRDPQDVAVDADANVYVADTGNHRIRRITPEGSVTTVAGDGQEGFADGVAAESSFSYPAGVALYYDESDGLVLFVSDTNNHRIRKIVGDVAGGAGTVSCHAGRCRNGTESFTRSKDLATPEAGFADGDGTVARFDGPSGLAAGVDGTLYVADTNNHLIRLIVPNSTVFTLAGGLEGAAVDSGGEASCPPPCLKGVAGHVDGILTEARFNYPADVSLGANGTLLVADVNSLRRVSMPEDPTAVLGVGFDGRVTTVAGSAGSGEADGTGPEARFARPSGVTSTADGAAYIADAASCRLRRVGPTVTFASAPVTCNTTLVEVVRPSGCSSYDPPRGGDGLMVSPLSGNVWYNSWRNLTSFFGGNGSEWGEQKSVAAAFAAESAGGYGEDATSVAGRILRQCLGFPPPDRLDRANDPRDTLAVDDGLRDVPEDTGVGTTIRIACPVYCLNLVADGVVDFVRGGGGGGGAVLGSPEFYADTSAVCMAAVHAGLLTADSESSSALDGRHESETAVVLVVARLLPGNATAAARAGFVANNVTSGDAPAGWGRGFALELAHPAEVTAQTIAGKPAGALGEGCGDVVDGQPPQEAVFGRPAGIDAWAWGNLTDETFLYVADAGNHAIRAVSAVCSFVCENHGTCVGPDSCRCPSGWTGQDCSLPSCTEALCGPRELCVGPEECDCIPGYTGPPSCQDPLCVQQCENGGTCAAPDACACADGWFGPNCTVPVCPQTCGNGGNCTAPGVCSCASEWSGGDDRATVASGGIEIGDGCRVPVCDFTCLNGGWCVAPGTCACPPQWTSYDCALPVCTQGYFLPGYNTSAFDPPGRPPWSERYVPCDVEGWCNSTNGFDCSQPRRSSEAIAVKWGANHRAENGRSEEPNRCMMLELGRDVVTPFPYLTANNESTPFARYSPLHPYEWAAEPRHPWSAYNDTAPGRTGPFFWEQDRQVALVEYHNVTDGRYVCANGGNCTSPDICECASGWSGFDCRTPICSQGYYEPEQTQFVSGFGRSDDVDVFEPFFGDNVSAGYRLRWPYSNPNYTLQWERFDNGTSLATFDGIEGNARYLGPSTWSADGQRRTFTHQGGYYCSIRAYTEFENEEHVTDLPNYWSRYMDTKLEDDNVTYSFWNMQWPPLHSKSARLELVDSHGHFYVYTDVGYMRDGDWSATGASWQKGVCIVQFNRACPADRSKAIDLQSVALYGDNVNAGLLVQDTDLSYRPRVTYNIWREEASGRWQEEGGECVDHVIRGCYNNGTCVGPDVCECAEGWTGFDCSEPICPTPCEHNGNCTLPGVCTCARGWTGDFCTEAVCASDCNNGGTCVAPDACKCQRWDSLFMDGREAGGRPLYRKPNGDAQQTGWTGYDCSVPICVQAEKFVLNVADDEADDYAALGGHGFDGTLACELVRCPKYDYTYVTNLGTSFQTGCGYDPLDSGCCYWDSPFASWTCEYCADPVVGDHSFSCGGDSSSEVYTDVDDIPSRFIDSSGEVNLCGSDLSPLPPYVNADPTRSDWKYSSHSLEFNVTSGRYLCSRLEFKQGDFVDDAGLGSSSGFGTDSGLVSGRHIRSNYDNYTQVDDDTWTQGDVTAGEGVYKCHNGGSCIAPDTCSCPDGWDGYDCETPVCRHLQPSGVVSSCQHGGICAAKDDCACIAADSVLWQVYEGANRDITGWTGTDCSMPMCAQGFFDPFCTDLAQAPGGEGCFRCPNGGVCSAPDHCDCAEGWTGYDCRTPVCEVLADDLMRTQLNTLDEEIMIAFESDPCAMEERYAAVHFEGVNYFRGNCTAPNQCTCMCWAEFDVDDCANLQTNCDGPWQDPLVEYRDVLPVTYAFGTRRCWSGYEGIQSDDDRFMTCHYNVFEPSWVQRNSIPIIIGAGFLAFFGSIVYFVVRRRLKRRFLQAKLERRRSRRSSEMSQVSQQPHVFAHRG